MPRTRSYTIHSGVFIEAVPPTITMLSPAPVAAGTQVLASDLFSASDLLDNAVATIQWGDGDQSLCHRGQIYFFFSWQCERHAQLGISL